MTPLSSNLYNSWKNHVVLWGRRERGTVVQERMEKEAGA